MPASPHRTCEPIPLVEPEWARARRGECIHAARSIAQADLYAIEWEGHAALLKDFSGRPRLVRALWSRAIVAREVRALARVQGLQGVPRLLARVGREGRIEGYIMERLAAGRLPHRGEPSPPREFWGRARALLEAMHAAGVAHGDLRRKNLLMDDAARPYLIDFATAVWRRRGAGALRRFVFERCRRIDRITLVRLKASYDPAALDDDDRQCLANEPAYLRVARFLKKWVYQMRKPRFWRRRAKRLRYWWRRNR